MSNITFAFLLTVFAGLSTGIGSLLAFITKKTNTKILSIALGFSAGVMIYISLVEILPLSKNILNKDYGNFYGHLISVIAFFGGIFLIAIIDKLIPEYENPHEPKSIEDININLSQTINLKRLSLFSALAIAIHNFPEGLVTFTGALQNPTLGISIAIAIAIHNIPEGIAVSIPLYYATGNRKKAFILSLFSGLAEPLGAIIGYLILLPFMNDLIYGIIFASVAGIMVFISLDELLPTAEKYGKHHLAIYGLISGMVVMAFSLIFTS